MMGAARHGVTTRDRKILVGCHAAAFDRLSRFVLAPLHRCVADRVVAALPPEGALLDVGTGPGHLLVEVARRRPDVRVIGVDPSADMVGYAHRRAAAAGRTGNIDVRVAAAEALPFDDQTFDVVVSTLSAHHWADMGTAVAEQERVLRPGGQMWVLDLRRHAAGTVSHTLGAHRALAVHHPPLGAITRLWLVCWRADKAPLAGQGITAGS